MNSTSAAEKISDLFQVTLTDLETNIISQAIKFNNQPQKLVDVNLIIYPKELQQSLNEYKARFFESIQHLLTFIAQLCGNNGKEVLKIASQVESQVTKFKQQQLLIQMKQVVHSKLRALMDTFYSDNKQKQDVQKEIQQLTDSLHKIEYTLMESNPLNIPQYITPYPKKNFFTASDQMTPNISDEQARSFYITPDQQQQEPRQFEHQPSSSENASVAQNKTLNSFNQEFAGTVEFQSDQSPQFGQKLFQNEIVGQYFSQVYNAIDYIKEEDQVLITENSECEIQRKQSTQSAVQKTSHSPKQKRLINTSKSKEQISRSSRSSLESTNLLQKLNQAEDQTIKKKQIQNKENQPKQNQSKQKPVVQIQKPKQMTIKSQQVLKKAATK
ncbi:hypothetical protein pb186bvf_010393 [Paramecium bursaria]